MSPVRKGKGFVNGIEDIVNRHLRLGKLSYGNKKACRLLSDTPIVDFDGGAFVSGIYEQIEVNAKSRLLEISSSKKPPSSENWRWEPRMTLTDGNAGKGHTGAEVPLERTIAMLSKMQRFGLRNSWTNQMPVGSGLTKDRDGGRRIDLVHRAAEGVYYFIELKTSGPGDSDSPLHAAVELLTYALVYVYSRAHKKELNYDSSLEVLRDSAKQVHLRVLAPEDFYKFKDGTGAATKYKLKWFENAIDSGLSTFLKVNPRIRNLCMTFRFEEVKQDFIQSLGDHGFKIEFDPQPVQWKGPAS